MFLFVERLTQQHTMAKSMQAALKSLETIVDERGPPGDDSRAKAVVGALIERLGFFGIDLGSLTTTG